MNWINYLRNVLDDKQSVKEQTLAILAARKALLIHDFSDTIEVIKNDSDYLNCNGPIEKVKYLREVHAFSLFEANTIYNYIRGADW